MGGSINTEDLARRVKLEVTIGGHDATSYLEPYVVSFEYTDSAEGKSDELSIEMHDRDDKWIDGWLPKKGTAMTARIHCLNWLGPGKHLVLPCGSFTCDEPTISGPPSKVSIKGVSASLAGPLRDTMRSQAWEGFSLQGVAGEVASRNNLQLHYDAEPHQFERHDQRNESDLAFVQRLAERNGASVKVREDKLILYSAKDADARPAGLTFYRKNGGDFTVTSYDFKSSSEGTSYTACTVEYHDPATRELHTYTYNPGGGAATGDSHRKILVLDGRVENEADAMKLAQNSLRGGNKGETTGSFEVKGYPGLLAGMTVQMSGFGMFSGKYFVTKATHSVGDGYTTKAEIRMTLGY